MIFDPGLHAGQKRAVVTGVWPSSVNPKLFEDKKSRAITFGVRWKIAENVPQMY